VSDPKTSKEKWEAIVGYATSADADSIADMSEEEIDRELAAAGADAVALAEEGRGEHEAALAASTSVAGPPTARPPISLIPPTPPRPLDPPRWRGITAVAAAVFVMLGFAWWSGVLRPPEPVVTHPNDALAGAKRLRDLAAGDCDAHRWRACLTRLDSARDLDPEGDGEPQVQKWRGAATAAIGSGDQAGQGDAGSRPDAPQAPNRP
jgi:hypothetical protein